MMKILKWHVLGFIVLFASCTNKTKPTDADVGIFDTDKLVAWCIVPFDALDRSPEERAVMLKELGITKLAYDYRERHLKDFSEEIDVLREHNIQLSAVWLWIQPTQSSLLDSISEEIVSTIEGKGVKTEFWVSFPDEFFQDMDDAAKLEKAVETFRSLDQRLTKAGCRIALYNHGDWFGEPENQVKIIEALDSDNIGMVFNFHHAHHQIDRFEEIYDLIAPYLTTVNINGMSKGGPKIITIGKGEEELDMLRILVNKGYKGGIGILGHTEGEDIKPVLQRNLKGLQEIVSELK